MSDFRIQKAISAATKDCLNVLDQCRAKGKSINRSGLKTQLLVNYPLTAGAADKVIDTVSRQHFDLNGDELVPKHKKSKA